MTRGGNTRKTGARYELLAAVHLEKCGYRIIEKNYRCRIGEIDLVACDGAYLVFVEVKYRKQQEGRCGSGRIHSKAENDQPRGRLLYESSRDLCRPECPV